LSTMMQEIPCRDTDPDPYLTMSVQEEDRASPIAFTVDFGGQENAEEKHKKLERFALRSSQRKPKSPRGVTKHENEDQKQAKVQPKAGSKLTTPENRKDDIRMTQSGARAFPRQKSDLTRERDPSRRRISSGQKSNTEHCFENSEMKAHLHLNNNGTVKQRKEYSKGAFDSDSDDNEDNVDNKPESNPSETGTYTVDKEQENNSFQETRNELDSLVESNHDKSSYVEEWASKHAFSSTNVEQLSPREAFSPEGTKSSLTSNKSRRMLPATPNAHPTRSPDVLTFSPDSEQGSSLTPPNVQESDDDDSSYVTHTQHLVDVMEERIKQKTLKKVEMKSTTTVSRNMMTKSNTVKQHVKSNKNTIKSPEPNQEAMEAWKRRKNYDPMAAAGRKKTTELTRKHSASSSKSGMRSPRDPLIVNEDTSESENYQNVSLTTPSSLKQSGPSSAKSRSSESSGYMSRSGEKSKRSVARESSNYAARSAPNPLRKLAHTNSTSSLKVQSNRSSSSLTSKEAEFQAWKRRKNYDPLKSATRNSSSRNTSASSQAKSAYSPSPTEMKQSPQHKRIQDMTQSLMLEENGQGFPIHRSNSFHCSNKKANRICSEDDSEDDYGSGYDSSIAESQVRKHPHYYLDDDELILPIQSSHSHLAQRSFYGPKSPQISPSKSRSKLEALDSLVISTIYNVSNKLCGASANVLRKAVNVFPEQDEEQASTIETVLYLLEDVDLPATPAKKTSRELSGTLRNMKKIEQALEMLNKVMELEEDD